MTPHYSKIHNRFKLNGLHYNREALKEVAYSLIKEGESHEKSIGDFLIDWLNDKDFVFVKTSGSTGAPKIIRLQKQTMVNSAIATGDFFKLEPGHKALHCLPSEYIAGKMMLVRALILGLEIDYVQPTTMPVFDTTTPYDFCAMIPLQVHHCIDRVNTMRTIIIGGARVPKDLIEDMQSKTTRFFETYGMTETATHVALKRLNGEVGDDLFTALPGVTFEKDQRDCLVISAPSLVEEVLITNDVVDLMSDKEFVWLGRYDNVINSGGLKLFPERIEGKLQNCIQERYIIASEPDETLGEQLILIVEKPNDSIEAIQSKLASVKALNKHEIPKKIYAVDAFSETDNGKIQRKHTVSIALD